MPQHAPDVGQEAHVEHAVRLVEHQHLEAAQGRIGLPEVVEQAAGRRHDHVDTRAEGVLLRTHAHSAEDGEGAHGRVHRELLEVRLDLGRELPGRREDERPRGAPRLVHQSMQDGQPEGGGLAAAGGGAGEDVASLHRRRDGLELDRRRPREAELANAP